MIDFNDLMDNASIHDESKWIGHFREVLSLKSLRLSACFLALAKFDNPDDREEFVTKTLSAVCDSLEEKSRESLDGYIKRSFLRRDNGQSTPRRIHAAFDRDVLISESMNHLERAIAQIRAEMVLNSDEKSLLKD